ncbi:MAG: class I SAM-dependent methyltransferase [Myxococcales bacterium]|nr:class I SAM-dependent methyltransferase [Myxococcales bacterium]
MTPPEKKQDFIPALRFRSLTRYFDWVLDKTLKEDRFRTLLIDQANIEPGQRILDIGCGTGTLAIMLKQRFPTAHVTALDADPDILALARAKADQAGCEIDFQQTLAWEADFPPESFDRVLSSLVLHHLRPGDKRRTLQAAKEWLRPKGELHIADWGKAQNLFMRSAFFAVQLLDGFETTAENVAQGLVPCIDEAGFSNSEETHREATMFGTLSLYRAGCA